MNKYRVTKIDPNMDGNVIVLTEPVVILANSPMEAKQKAGQMYLRNRGESALSGRNSGEYWRAGLVQGATDLPVGAMQLATKMGVPGGEVVDELVQDREERARIRNIGRGFDVPRMIGGIAGASPALMLKAAPTLLGRVWQGTKFGALFGAATPTTPDTNKFFEQKLSQIGVGAATGAILTPIFEGVVFGLTGAVNALAKTPKRLKNWLSGETRWGKVRGTIENAFKANGVEFNNLPVGLQDKILSELRWAMNKGGTMDEASMDRLASYIAQDIPSFTRGQVSRDPQQFTREQNLQASEAGAPLQQAFQSQTSQLQSNIDKMASRSGIPASVDNVADDYAMGIVAQRRLKEQKEALETEENKLWKAYRDGEGRDIEIDRASVGDAIEEIREEIGIESIVPAVKTRLEQLGFFGDSPKRPFNIHQIDLLKKLINNNFKSMSDAERLAVKRINRAIDESFESIEKGQMSEDVWKKLSNARDFSRRIYSLREENPALDAVYTNSLVPDEFIKKFVLKIPVKNFEKLVNQLGQGDGQALAHLRYRIIMRIKEAAAPEGEGFSYGRLKGAIDRIGGRKLKMLLGDKEWDYLQQLMRVTKDLKKAPEFSRVNYSGSGVAVLNMLDRMMGRVTNVPYVTEVQRAIGKSAQKAEVGEALKGTQGVINELPPIIPPDLGRRGRGRPLRLLTIPPLIREGGGMLGWDEYGMM